MHDILNLFDIFHVEVLSSTIMLIDPLNLVSALLSDAVPSIVHRSDAHFLLADPQVFTAHFLHIFPSFLVYRNASINAPFFKTFPSNRDLHI